MSKRPLCVSPLCRARGYHWDDCEGGECRGCQPRLAVRGYQLCTPCIRRVSEDVTAVADLHHELEHSLSGSTGGGEKVATKPGSRVPNPAAMEARGRIRLLLVTWTRIVVEERSIATPADTIDDLATFLRRHAEWLTTQPYAGDVCSQFAEERDKARPIAYPNGTRRIKVGQCIKPGCEGILWAKVRTAGSAITCDIDDTHKWDTTQWMRLGKTLLAA